MTKFIMITGLLFLTACTTPQTVLKDPKTGKTTQCGGKVTGSLAGGVIGYNIQKNNDENCVEELKGQGFEIVGETS